jgi:hypothetical protein
VARSPQRRRGRLEAKGESRRSFTPHARNVRIPRDTLNLTLPVTLEAAGVRSYSELYKLPTDEVIRRLDENRVPLHLETRSLR